ncbi:CinA family protein [Sphingobium estronivorans]|uniref:CinA family protein n=1 Tax=Sphingobium estronivorans TaxID=1577690 RepID=UPI00123959C3|nr:CinA family protein [Sphingobium estronivorans]
MGEEPAIDGKAEDLAALASEVLELAQHTGLRIVTAESCTGGMLSSLLTNIEGLSSCFERGFAVYSDDAKTEMLGVEPKLIERYGAVSAEVARAMAQGALARSLAQIAVAITGFAGPGAKEDEEGLVHIALARESARPQLREYHFGRGGRDRTRHHAVQTALQMMHDALR